MSNDQFPYIAIQPYSMPLSWNEIKTRAAAFVKNWEHAANEDSEAKPFLIDFLQVFGHSQRKVATFEHRVNLTPSLSKGEGERRGYIDLIWKGMLLVEMKSRGKDLGRAYEQAKAYCQKMPEYELPQLIVVSDFEWMVVYDVDGNVSKFPLRELVKNVQLFAPIAGYIKREFKEQDPVNIQAAELMGKLHDKLKAIGYSGHALELYLVRLLFCLFADDSNIFNKDIFSDYLRLRTSEDGSDLARAIAELFQVLNTSDENRLANLDESLKEFPYVNGKLFEEQLPFASFDSSMRKLLLDCCLLDWGKISPAIFGSLFQSVMDEKARRNLGAHYTSEKNILKLIKPLFLDELQAAFAKARNSKAQLQKLHDRISSLRFLDPACGCGNFLIIAYRELRLLEIEIIKRLLQLSGMREEVLKEARMDATYLVKCNVDQFYGIEYDEFPAQIARTALWLMDHQMNMKVTDTFGEYFVRLPLKRSAIIHHGNALRTDWQSLIEPMPWDKGEARYDYILGNPPFVGSRIMNSEQKSDMSFVFGAKSNIGDLDYVSAWYMKAVPIVENSETKAAFVSTNSISQGLQPGILWTFLNKYKIVINFAHKTFKWNNEAKGNAAVYCVIIGFASKDASQKMIFDYEDIKGEAHGFEVKSINPYLIESSNNLLLRQQTPICNVPEMSFGNMPADGGQFLFTTEEKNIFLKREPNATKLFKRYMGAEEFINNKERWCLWLQEINPQELRALKYVLERVQKVRDIRKVSSRPKLAETPHLFAQITQPPGADYIIVPSVSSERRKYIPIGFENGNTISSNLCLVIPRGNLYHFGTLTSLMHMAWVKYVCGRLKSDYRYSKDIVYNNFPWPENPTDKQKEAVEKAAQAVLDVRAEYLTPAGGGAGGGQPAAEGSKGASLADLYDPNTMPPALVKAHQALDKAVDLCYRSQPFANETKRIEFLFELYDKYTAGMFGEGKKGEKK